jgi:hypothetical protein
MQTPVASEPMAEFRLTHLGVIPEDQGGGWDVIAWEFFDFTACIGHCKVKLACSVTKEDGRVTGTAGRLDAQPAKS